MEIPSQNAEEEGGELNVPEGEDLQSDAPKEGGEDLDIAGEDLQLDVPEEEEGDSNDFQLDAPKEGGELNVPEGEDLQSDAPKEGGEDLNIAGEDLQLDVPEEEGDSNDFQLDVPYLEGQNVEEKEQENDEPFQFKGSKRSGLRPSIKAKRTRVQREGSSESKDIRLLETESLGKILVTDGKLLSAEKDEFILHECLVHPALLFHHNPKSVFIMGGAQGSSAREVLKHRTIKKVVMCTDDKELVNFCRTNLTINKEAFRRQELHLVFKHSMNELENSKEKFDVIVGDLEKHLEEDACVMPYTRSFYEKIIKPRLNPMGIFVTLAGPAGVFTHKGTFTSIYQTLNSCFQYVRPYHAHVPSYEDTVGWVMASDQTKLLLEPSRCNISLFDGLIIIKIEGGQLQYLNGATIMASSLFNKIVFSGMMNVTDISKED